MLLAVALGLAGGASCILKTRRQLNRQPKPTGDLRSLITGMPSRRAAQVQGRDFETIWEICKTTARDYQFALDRDDYRSASSSTCPWYPSNGSSPGAPDTGSAIDVFSNSAGRDPPNPPLRNSRNADELLHHSQSANRARGNFERNVTDVSQYRFAFSGPATKIPTREAVNLDPDTLSRCANQILVPHRPR